MSDTLQQIRKLCQLMVKANQGDHFHSVGMSFTGIEKGFATMELPYSEAIVGNPETGVVHGGAITALLDTCCGFAANAALEELSLCPTLDLRIDYMGVATPGQTIYAEARAYRSTRHVIFCRGKAYQDDPDRPVAFCVANFARLDPELVKKLSAQIMPFLDAMEDPV